MGEETPTEILPLEQKLKEFLQDVPTVYTSFKEGVVKTKLQFLYFSGETAKGETIEIDYYPFQTVYDLRVKIAMNLSQKLRYSVDPLHVTMIHPAEVTGERENKVVEPIQSAELTPKYKSFLTIWRSKTIEGGTKSRELELENPFLQAKGSGYGNFVKPNGEPFPVENDDQSRMLIEDILKNFY